MYAATFQRLFEALVAPHTRVTEVACTATGADVCRFRIVV
jgi:bacteriochlorophyll 4-vinyl reductase